MTETERSGLLARRTASPISPIEPTPDGKLDVKDFGEDASDDSRQEKVFKRKETVYVIISGEQKTFSSGTGLVLSCLGSVVGTGNIWRYPRIVALHAGGGGDITCIHNRELCIISIFRSSGILNCLVLFPMDLVDTTHSDRICYWPILQKRHG